MKDPASPYFQGNPFPIQPTTHEDKCPIYQAYLENSLAPAWIGDEDGYIVFINAMARKIWKLDQLCAHRHIYDLFPRHIADEFLASDKKVLDSGESLSVVISSFREDGSQGFYRLHKYLLSANTPRRLIAGQAIDISEEIKAQNELLKSNERFLYVTKATSECIWDWNLATGEIYRSEALIRLSGYREEEIRHNLDWWYEKTHPDDRERVMNKLASCIRQRQNYCEDEYRFLCADGSYKNFSDNGYFIYHDGKPLRAIGAVQDITEKRRLEAELLRQNIQKQKEITQAVIAAQDHACNELSKELHDNVNQILYTVNLLLGHVQNNVCGDGSDCIPKSQQYVQMALGEIRKISKSLSSSIIKDIGLIGPVEEIVTNLALHLPARVNFTCAPVLERQLSYEHKLMIYRIIQEQTNNIIKYAEASEITVEEKKGSIYMKIRDNGKGFDPGTVRRGIGLANMRNRVEAFSGTLTITTSPGKGCSIEIAVPVTPSSPTSS
ncbi:MAG TPA: PAS domain-containing protein, partial [Puia sp.]